jgi:chromosome partitioning protein
MAGREQGPRVVVVGNMKGGTGKSTVAVHLAIALLYRGYEVGALDLDHDQGTLTRYLENRRSWRRLDPLSATGAASRFPMPRQAVLGRPGVHPLRGADAAAAQLVGGALADLADCDFVVIDTPGSPSALARAGHEKADVLITPINDSLVDIDVLADIDTVSRTVVAPSCYSRMVMDDRDRRPVDGRGALDWIVIRNRLPHVFSYNRRDIERLLLILAERLGFRQAPGFIERVVFREHFPTGLTALDMTAASGDGTMPASQIAARREIDALAEMVSCASRTAPAMDAVLT